MNEYITTVTRKGQITIPVDIRRALGIEEGDKIAVALEGEDAGVIVVRPVRSVADMTYGLAAALSRESTQKELIGAHEWRDQFEAAAAQTVMDALDRSKS